MTQWQTGRGDHPESGPWAAIAAGEQEQRGSVSLRDVVGDPDLAVTLLTSGYDGVEVNWSHSSDLEDPSPFLGPGQLLLTTGRQFSSFAPRDYRAYVGRLVDAGVVALGFGTEVVRSGTPAELIAACEEAKVALVEVPYATPFIAVSKYIADRIASQSRRRLEWALAAQEAISTAVLGSGELAAAVRVASAALECRLAVLDADGEVLEGAAPAALRERALELLRRGSRARDSGGGEGGFWTVHTLGRSGRLLGAVVVLRTAPFAPLESSVVTMLAALTELSLEHTEDQRLGFRSIGSELFRLLRAGKVEAVDRALAYLPARLPREPFQVIAVPIAELAPPVRDALERMAAGRTRRLFTVQHGDQFLLLVDSSSHRPAAALLAAAGVRGGISADAHWDGVEEALAQASGALAGASPGSLLHIRELTEGRVLGLLTEARVAELAKLRFGALLRSPLGRARLEEAALWLRCNAAWDPAARELGLHRHTLKQRIASLGQELGLPLDEFGGRAELWAMLAAVDLASRGNS